MKKGVLTFVNVMPACDFCKTEVARYDFKTADDGQWAHGCEGCFPLYRAFAQLGEGRGQVLAVYRPGSMIGEIIALLPFGRRPVYMPAFVLVTDDDQNRWRGIACNQQAQPTDSVIYTYARSVWRKGG
jgi:hypothetical protein